MCDAHSTTNVSNNSSVLIRTPLLGRELGDKRVDVETCSYMTTIGGGVVFIGIMKMP